MLKPKRSRFGLRLAGVTKLLPNLATGVQNLATVIFSVINSSLRVTNTFPCILSIYHQLPPILRLVPVGLLVLGIVKIFRLD